MPSITGQLQKLKLKAYRSADYAPHSAVQEDGEFEVQVNPEAYTVSQTIEYTDTQPQGTNAQQLNYGRSKPQNLEFEFIFDGTGIIPASGIAASMDLFVPPPKPDIIDAIMKFKKVVYDYDGEQHEPPYVKIYWGTLLFKCRLTSLAINYKLFNPDGTPIRAIAKCAFTGTIEDNLRVALANPQSPDLTHLRTVQEGESLPLMTYRIYGDENLYLEIARINKLTNFRQLQPGTQLIFPPLKKNAT